jgi:serine phosphatase RsbU (regulator of sigma subunit)
LRRIRSLAAAWPKISGGGFLTEAANASGALFSEDRLATVLGNASGAAEDLVSAVAAPVTQFVGDAPRSDDITPMAIRLVES